MDVKDPHGVIPLAMVDNAANVKKQKVDSECRTFQSDVRVRMISHITYPHTYCLNYEQITKHIFEPTPSLTIVVAAIRQEKVPHPVA